MKIDLRTQKLQVALYTRGLGLILFAVWSFLRIFIVSFAQISSTMGQDLGVSPIILFLLDFVCGGIDAAQRIYIGRSAIVFSSGGKLRRFSLFLAGFYTILCAMSLIFVVVSMGLSGMTMTTIAGLVVDAAVCVLNVEIIALSRRLNKMNRADMEAA